MVVLLFMTDIKYKKESNIINYKRRPDACTDVVKLVLLGQIYPAKSSRSAKNELLCRPD